MSSVSTLTLALSVFSKNDMRAISVNKSHPKNYHIYYRANGVDRVMSIPKECYDFQKLQSEVEVLIKRNLDEQHKVGIQDG